MKISIKDIDNLGKKGIYQIKNIKNNKIYIGSTTTSFKKRIKLHLISLNKNKHHNVYLQYSFNKYGIENFEFSIVEIMDCILEEIRQKESYFINYFKSLSTLNGYNISDITSSPPSNESIRNKISNTLKNKYKNDLIFIEKMRKISDLRKGKPSWNIGRKCNNISNSRKELFDDIEVYDINMKFFRKFDNPIEIEKFSKLENNDLPIIEKVPYYGNNCHSNNITKISYKKIKNKIIFSQNIYRSIRNNKPYKGLFFKKVPRNSDITCK